jgi:hypothetical protein
MQHKIQLENNCQESFKKMPSVKGGRFCNTCQTKVVDFTNMSLEEINTFFENKSLDKICGIYSARHTDQKSRTLTFTNKIENIFFKTKFRRMATWTITTILFLTNAYKCMGKKVVPKSHWKEQNIYRVNADTLIKK